MILVLLQRDEPTLDLWFETQGQFSSKTSLTFISVLDCGTRTCPHCFHVNLENEMLYHKPGMSALSFSCS